MEPLSKTDLESKNKSNDRLLKSTETQSKLIFIADDNEGDRKNLTIALEHLGFPFRFVFMKNGEELLQNLELYYSENQSFPKMILLDYNMEKENGYPSGKETLRMIKSHFLYKTIPVLVLSDSRTDNIVIEVYNLGANSFIIKPATLQEFENFVRTLNSYWFELAAI